MSIRMEVFRNNYPFYAFICLLFLFLSCTAALILLIFLAIKGFYVFTDKIIAQKLIARIKKNPYLGSVENGQYIFKEEGFTLKYRITPPVSAGASAKVEFISLKNKLRPLEEGFIDFKKNIGNFLIYHQWLFFFKSLAFFALLSAVLTFYFLLFEPPAHQAGRWRWIISSLLRLHPDNVEVKPGGRVKVWGSRLTAVDRQDEPISYNVYLYPWLTFQDEGFITRWRGRLYGYVDHPLEYNDTGAVGLEKEDIYRFGRIYLNRAHWDQPQGTGIRKNKVLGHDMYLRQGEFALEDE